MPLPLADIPQFNELAKSLVGGDEATILAALKDVWNRRGVLDLSIVNNRLELVYGFDAAKPHTVFFDRMVHELDV